MLGVGDKLPRSETMLAWHYNQYITKLVGTNKALYGCWEENKYKESVIDYRLYRLTLTCILYKLTTT